MRGRIDELVGLAGRRGRLRLLLARLAAEMIARRGPARLGYARPGDYARERLGIAPRQLRELARTGARLEKLPALRRALASGGLSWTAARLVARVARPEDEMAWIGVARRVTSAELEHQVRAVDRGAVPSLAGAGRGSAAASHAGTDERVCSQDGGPGDSAGAAGGARAAARHGGTQVDPGGRAAAGPGSSVAEASAAHAAAPHPGGVAGRDGRGCAAGTPGTAAAELPKALPHDRDGSRRVGVQAACSAEVVGLWWRVRRLASRVAGEQLVPWQAMEWACAEVLSALPVEPDALERERRAVGLEAERDASELVAGTPGADGGLSSVGSVEPAGAPDADGSLDPEGEADGEPGWVAGSRRSPRRADLRSEAGPGRRARDPDRAFALDARLRAVLQAERCLDARLGSLLLHALEHGLHRAAGFARFDSFVRERLGFSPRKARALVRVARFGRRWPVLARALDGGELSWVRAQVLLPLAALPGGAPHGEAWVRWALAVTVRRLEEDVERALLFAEVDSETFAKTGGLPEDALHVGPTCRTASPESLLSGDATGLEAPHGGTSPEHASSAGPAGDPGLPEGRRDAGGPEEQHGGSRRIALACTPERPRKAAERLGEQASAVGEAVRAGPSGGWPIRASSSVPDRSVESSQGGREPPRRRDGRRRPWETHRFFFTAPPDVAALFRATLCTVRKRIEAETGALPSEGEAAAAIFAYVLHAWEGHRLEDPALARRWERVFARDGWRCAVPGCSSMRNLQDHHIVYRSLGGGDELPNRVTLCAFHHLRGEHAGVVRVRGRAPDRLRFELGLRARRRPLEVFGSGDRRLEAGPVSAAPCASPAAQ